VSAEKRFGKADAPGIGVEQIQIRLKEFFGMEGRCISEL
jgi:hypothetical protein